MRIQIQLFLICFLVCVFGDVGLWAQEEFRETAAQELAEFISDTEFGLQDCMYKVDAIVNSAPDADILFESKGHFEYLKKGKLVWKCVTWNPVYIQGKGSHTGESAGFCRESRWGSLSDGEANYVLIVNRDNPRSRELSKEKLSQQASRANFVSLFDWPFHVDSVFFRQITQHDGLAKVYFADAKQCRTAQRNPDGTLRSLWVKFSKTQGLKFVTTKDGVPIRFEVVVLDKQFDASQAIPNPKQGTIRYDVRTTWKEFNGIKVPSHVESIMKSPSEDLISLVADFTVVGEDNETYKTTLADLEKRVIEARLPSN